MKRHVVLALSALCLLAACKTNPVPEGYAGPLAHIKDSFQWRSASKGDFFYVAKVNGNKIDNNLDRTTAASHGAGFKIIYANAERDIPARPCTLTIMGRTHYAAPIQELTNTVYEVSGTVDFTPEPRGQYEIKGELGERYSAVWIEDRATKQTVGKKIEIQGSAGLGFFEK